MTTRGEAAFGLGQFGTMLAELEGQMDLTPEELCLLGRAELRCAHYDAAELHLLRASLLGVQGAAAEYAEVLYETGRSAEAARWLHTSMPELHSAPPDLHAARARHLLVRMALAPAVAGVSLELLAEQAQAVAQLFLARGEEEEAGQVAVTLAEISLLGGDRRPGDFQVRPYPGGGWLSTIVQVPAGRSLAWRRTRCPRWWGRRQRCRNRTDA